MTRFEVVGSFRPGGEERTFAREVDAPNEDVAREHVLTQLGSEHRMARTQIAVDEVREAEA